MKSTLETIILFFAEHGINPSSINLKLTIRGQVEVCTGTFEHVEKERIGHILKQYRKKLVANDYRFNNTELDFNNYQFIITSR